MTKATKPKPVASRHRFEALAAAVIVGTGESPLEFALRIMRDKSKELEYRLAACRMALPFCHQQLKAIEITGPNGGPITHAVEIVIVDPDPR